MNDYKVIYIARDGETETAIITERSESAATKALKARFKAAGEKAPDVIGAELHAENTTATKAQEREVLEAIKKMVEELGPQSYVAAAFEGCFQDAELNIENDWGCSQKQLADAAAERVTELEAQVKELEKKLHDEIGEKQTVRDELARARKATEGLEELEVILCERAEDAEHKAAESAERIVKYADNPDSEEFKAAVREHRSHLEFADYNKLLAGRISGYTCEAHAGA